MTLVDDIDGDAAGDKQFIVVQSKGGNYFYIIIDKADEGNNTVHFLNQVDEADLLSLIDEEVKTPEVCNCADKCVAGAVNTSCPVCKNNMTECVGKEKPVEPPTEPDDPTDEPDKEKSGGNLLIVHAPGHTSHDVPLPGSHQAIGKILPLFISGFCHLATDPLKDSPAKDLDPSADRFH